MTRAKPAISQARGKSTARSPVLVVALCYLKWRVRAAVPEGPVPKRTGRSGRTSREHQRLQHFAGRAILDECGHAQVSPVRPRQKRQSAILPQLRVAAEVDRSDPFAHDEVV